jgi:hypothetical protein
MTTTYVHSWNELQDAVFVDAWRPDLLRFRSPYAFRGLCASGQTLETTLNRLGGNSADLERHLLRNFRKYAQQDVVEYDSVWNWLAVAKHHGLPTRLLDWSFSPLVAMHFATSNIENFHMDSMIWAVNYVAIHKFLPKTLYAVLSQEGAGVFTADMLADTVPDLEDLAQLSQDPFVIFFEPPSLDERIINQFALFSLMSSADATLDRWLEQHPGLYHKIVIPAELKWEIRDKLDQANITERVLFPGLDGLSSWLKRHYTPRGYLDKNKKSGEC